MLGPMVRVRVLYFAAIRERIGLDQEDLDLPERTTDRAVLALVGTRHPAAAPLLAPCRIAVDQAFIRGEVALRTGAEVAVIPPVSGG